LNCFFSQVGVRTYQHTCINALLTTFSPIYFSAYCAHLRGKLTTIGTFWNYSGFATFIQLLKKKSVSNVELQDIEVQDIEVLV
jgi:hypothetical protein